MVVMSSLTYEVKQLSTGQKTAKLCGHRFCYFPTFLGVTKTLPWQDIRLISKHPKQWAIWMMETLSMNPLFGWVNHSEHTQQITY